LAGSQHTVGTSRRFFKLTELDEERGEELDAAARNKPFPAEALRNVARLTSKAPDRPCGTYCGKRQLRL